MPVINPNAKRPKVPADTFIKAARAEAEAMKKDPDMKVSVGKKTVKKSKK